MDASQVADLEGTIASAGVVALVALALLRIVSRERFEALRAELAGSGMAFAASVALVATLGSLWFSEGAHFPPCKLCWYQRIAMYPLVVLLGLAAVRRDRAVRFYGLAIAGVGLTISAWHNVVETFPSIESGACDPTNPCTIRWVEGLGFWTIPRMAFVAFLLIIAALALDHPSRAETP
jgi:disulfide bond formation protein DsbB